MLSSRQEFEFEEPLPRPLFSLFSLHSAVRQRKHIWPMRVLNRTQISSDSQAAKVIAGMGFNRATVCIIKLLNRRTRGNETVLVCPLDRWWLFNNLFSFFLFNPPTLIHRASLPRPACYSIIIVIFLAKFSGMK